MSCCAAVTVGEDGMRVWLGLVGAWMLGCGGSATLELVPERCTEAKPCLLGLGGAEAIAFTVGGEGSAGVCQCAYSPQKISLSQQRSISAEDFAISSAALAARIITFSTPSSCAVMMRFISFKEATSLARNMSFWC